MVWCILFFSSRHYTSLSTNEIWHILWNIASVWNEQAQLHTDKLKCVTANGRERHNIRTSAAAMMTISSHIHVLILFVRKIWFNENEKKIKWKQNYNRQNWRVQMHKTENYLIMLMLHDADIRLCYCFYFHLPFSRASILRDTCHHNVWNLLLLLWAITAN